MSTPRKLTSLHRATSARKLTSRPSAVAAAVAPYETVIFDTCDSGDSMLTEPRVLSQTRRIMPFVSALCYKGLEVVLASHDDDCIDIILSRSRMILQRLKVNGEIIGIFANHVNGMISVVTSRRKVFNFHPVPTLPSGKSTKSGQPVTAFGKYFWMSGRVVDCASVFSCDVPFEIRGNQKEATVHIGSSIDYKLLVAHTDQLAVFDISPPFLLYERDQVQDEEEEDEKEEQVQVQQGQILWTTRVGATISCATISGDGRAIVYVLVEGEGVGGPYPFGARTFIRDKEDGSNDGEKTENATSSKHAAVGDESNKEGQDKNSSHDKDTSWRTGGGGNTLPPFPTMEVKLEYDKSLPTGKVDMGTKLKMADLNNSGIVYKSGPFLVHSSTVTRVSFRGQGLNHSSVYHDDYPRKIKRRISEGNDLLMTCCSSEGSFRVFSQGSWKMLFHWDTPPGSRADWIHGITMANLGDLDPLTKTNLRKRNNSAKNEQESGRDEKSRKNNDSFMPPRNDRSPNIHTRNATVPSSGWHSQLVPNSAAGAWISEITFRGPYPALRLSRLSFLKSGGDSWAPAHFDSVGTILPPATMLPQCILHNIEDTSMIIQGIWSAWDPWVAHPGSGGSVVEDESLSGNAMALLGSVPYSYGGFKSDIDATIFGGTHSPPAELRIVASYIENKVAIIELPLWGDTDFGAIQLGSPLRYLLNLKDIVPPNILCSKSNQEERDSQVLTSLPTATSKYCKCLEFESNILCASVSEDKKNISLEWRVKGTMNIAALEDDLDNSSESPTLERIDSDISIATTVSLDSEYSHGSFTRHDERTKKFSDLSLIPLPISLPPLHLPAFSKKDEHFSSLHWWPDENFGGPPRLLALTSTGTLVIYEMPPPWSALEPISPDPLLLNSIGNSCSEHGSLSDRESFEDKNDEDYEGDNKQNYEVDISPHPDFGLGLRLEAQGRGMPAIAGSYKRHPLTGGRLPAERAGSIVLGDELLSINGVALEGLPFEKIIKTIRDVSSVGDGAPLKMRFRAVEKNRILHENLSNVNTDQSQEGEGLEIVQRDHIDEKEQVSVLVGADAEIQQEFGRVVAVINGSDQSSLNSSRPFILLPWHYGKGAPVPYQVRGVALLVSAVGRTISASRVEVLNGHNPESCGNLTAFGNVDIGSESEIVSLVQVKTALNGWCVGACNSDGGFHLIFIDVEEGNTSSSLAAEFRTIQILRNITSGIPNKNLIRAHSMDFIAAMPTECVCHEVSVWSLSPFIPHDKKSEGEHFSSRENYQLIKISHLVSQQEPIIDFRWASSGRLDAFPWLITFSKTSAVVHCRSAEQQSWVPKIQLFYPMFKESCPDSGVSSIHIEVSLSPVDMFPHIVTAVRNILSYSDERHHLLADWHPEAILSTLCLETAGVQHALSTYTMKLLSWLAEWMNTEDTTKMHWDKNSRLSCAPFSSLYGSFGKDLEASKKITVERTDLEAAQKGEKDFALRKFLDCIKRKFDGNRITQKCGDNSKQYQSKSCMEISTNTSSSNNIEGNDIYANESSIPDPLRGLDLDELCFLWCIGELCKSPPNFSGLDKLGQITILCHSILYQLKDSGYKDGGDNSKENASPYNSRMFLVKLKSTSGVGTRKELQSRVQIASSGCLAALLSSSQNRILAACKPLGKWTWEAANAVNLPFWLRSDHELLKISNEIGQQVYKETLDVVEAALFFIAAGNTRMLKAIAATDRNESGKKFLKFITTYDFSSTRGRMAAEKNAFSLLRKRRYGPAAAFFLIAQPPMIKSALNVIVNKMDDIALAFFVARLVEGNISTNAAADGGPIIGGPLSFRGFGGGGGFVSPGDSTITESECSETSFESWKPNIHNFGRQLLENDAIPNHSGDEFMQCIYLHWLNRPNDGGKCLTDNFFTDAHRFRNNGDSFRSGFRTLRNSDMFDIASLRVVVKVNTVLNFACKPTIVKSMKLPEHMQWYTALTVSQAMFRMGIEFSSMSTLVNFAIVKPEDQQNRDAVVSNQNHRLTLESSIFDSCNVPQVKDSSTTVHPMEQSSMLKTGNKLFPPATTTHHVESSIFDSFDVPRAKILPANNKTAATTSDPMSSSIFDSFDVPPQGGDKKSIATASGQVSSSLFDSLPANKKTAATPSDPMSSSIFDSFDVPPQGGDKKSIATASGQVSSSIFDSFDVVLPARKMTSTGKRDSSEPTIPKTSALQDSKEQDEFTNVIRPDSSMVDFSAPFIWRKWKENTLVLAVARRLLREMARVINPFLGDTSKPPIALFRRHIHPLISYTAAHVFQEACDGANILFVIIDILDGLCSTFGVTKFPVIEQALIIIGCPHQPQRIVFAVLLHCLTGRADLAEDVMRDAAHDQIQRCQFLIAANDDLIHFRKTKFHITSQYARRLSVNMSFQLELCLWLHRGGAFPISGLAQKEVTAGVRIGYVVASWGRCHEALENLLKCEPDCAMDFDRGRQLWSSMKIISNPPKPDKISNGGVVTTSGGWEFLVECNREESTKLLETRPCGSFLIRPHHDDYGIFTLSFRTNAKANHEESDDQSLFSQEKQSSNSQYPKREDTVQHAIIRLSDAGFKCGSFGPYSSLLKLLESVSNSLPFDLLFNEPPAQGVIKEDGCQPSPNSVFIRKLALQSKTEHYRWNLSTRQQRSFQRNQDTNSENFKRLNPDKQLGSEFERLRRMGSFSQLLTLTELRKQIGALVASLDDKLDERSTWNDTKNKAISENFLEERISESLDGEIGEMEFDAIASRIIRPFLHWCRSLETCIVGDLFAYSR
jgi:RAVE protein 1 C terminal./SH2 domain.